jgi:hypothetical protein
MSLLTVLMLPELAAVVLVAWALVRGEVRPEW